MTGGVVLLIGLGFDDAADAAHAAWEFMDETSPDHLLGDEDGVSGVKTGGQRPAHPLPFRPWLQ